MNHVHVSTMSFLIVGAEILIFAFLWRMAAMRLAADGVEGSFRDRLAGAMSVVL